MISSVEQLNRLSIFEFPHLFASLDPPHPDSLRGIFRGSFTGPGWLRKLAGPMLAVTGLGGWWGKEFDSQGNAINLVCRKGQFERRFPMLLIEKVSVIDRKPGLALRYASSNPLPWPWIVDELRLVQPDLLLGMTMIGLAPFNRLALPFVLQPRENLHGL